MKRERGRRERAIDEALHACATDVEQTRAWQWRATLANGTRFAVDARAEGEWLSLSAPAGEAPGDCLGLLRLNHRLDAASRIALSLDAWSLELRSEVPLADGVNLPGRIREACTGLARASKRLRSGSKCRRDGGCEEQPARDRRPASMFADTCREAGWSFAEHRAGALAIELDVADSCHHAMLEPDDHSIALSVEIGCWDAASAATCDAVGVLMLSACHALRFARAAATDDGVLTTWFEVMFGEAPGARELDEALRALSTACRLYAREAAILRDEAIAIRFLDATRQRTHV